MSSFELSWLAQKSLINGGFLMVKLQMGNSPLTRLTTGGLEGKGYLEVSHSLTIIFRSLATTGRSHLFAGHLQRKDLCVLIS